MVEIRQMEIDSPDAQTLLQELNESLTRITGADGTAHFRQEDVMQGRSCFLVGYADGVPMGCGALRELNAADAEVKRVYARKNACHMGRKILEALEKKAAELHYERLLIETRVQNERAVLFYLKNGYVRCENYGAYIGRMEACCFVKRIEQK